MLSDRSYMRKEGGFGTGLSVTGWLLLSMAIAFFLQSIAIQFLRQNALVAAFSLSGASIKNGFIWSVFSYAFLHGNLLHLLVNGLLVFFIGRILEPVLGVQRYLFLFFVSVILGGLAWLLFHFNSIQELMGASAGALGILTYFCLLNPNQPITILLFFILPITLRPKWLLYITLGLELFGFIFEEMTGKSNIANSAHLGGMLAGFLCFKIFHQQGISFRSNHNGPGWFKKGFTKKLKNTHYHVNLAKRDELKQEVDRILDKINAHGFGALSKEERDILDKAKDMLSN